MVLPLAAGIICSQFSPIPSPLLTAVSRIAEDSESGEVAGEGTLRYRGDNDKLEKLEGEFNRSKRVKMNFKGEANFKVEGWITSGDNFEVDQINDIRTTGSGRVNNILKSSTIVDLKCTYKGWPLQIYFLGKSVIR